MKIVFYGTDGTAAKAYVKDLRTKKVACRLIHAEACREAQEFTSLEFRPDVSAYDQDRLLAMFGQDVPVMTDAPEIQELSLRIGKGPGGRWYVKDGKTVHSGPFANEAEANAALAKELGE